MLINIKTGGNTMKIIVATGNKGKLKEIKEIFSEYEIISNKEAGFNIDIEEDAKTFEGNALKQNQLPKFQEKFVLAMIQAL